MEIRARFDDLIAGESWELIEPARVLTARKAKEVPDLLDAVDDALCDGLYAGGFIAYEAAPAFDDALQVFSRSSDVSVPIAWFGLFGGRRRVAPVRSPESAAPSGPDCLPPTAPSPAWRLEISEEEHRAAVREIQEEIAAGWTYQANLTARLTSDFTGDPFDLYRQLATAQAGAYNAYIETDNFAVACASPELFFSISDCTVSSRPMKGTAERGRFPAEDAEAAAHLASSEKERAENLMIVDLVRSDLGRIARHGSVRVPELFACERYPTLWQLTSTVEAEIGPGIGLREVFSALFPCGSVTGAPKPSTMAILTRLEGSPRGIYCGAVGWAGAGSTGTSACFAVGIRTATVDKVTGRALYGAGGGITADSDPESEWDELLVKTEVLTHHCWPTELMETMRYTPEGGLRNLEGHLARLDSSAGYFGVGFSTDRGREELARATADLEGTWRVRLLLSASGTLRVECKPLDHVERRAVRLAIDGEPVDATDIRFFHKTTDRANYEIRSGRHPEADDVVMVNRDDQVTETVRANLAVCLDDRWWTPPVICGLLAGVERGRLVGAGTLAERVITRSDLFRAEALATVSSLRGWLPAELI